MIVVLAAIVMHVRGRDRIANNFQCFRGAAIEIRMSHIEADFYAREAGLFQKVFQVQGRRHLTRRIFNGEGNAAVSRKQGQIFKRAECGVPLALIRHVSLPRHVLHAEAKGNVLHEVERALDFVHRLLAPQTFGVANRERRAAFPGEMKISRRRGMNGIQCEIISSEPRSQLVRIVDGAVIEMSARAK